MIVSWATTSEQRMGRTRESRGYNTYFMSLARANAFWQWEHTWGFDGFGVDLDDVGDPLAFGEGDVVGGFREKELGDSRKGDSVS